MKCRHLYLRPVHHFGSYYLDNTKIDAYKGLGVLFDQPLKFHDHTTKDTAKANWIPAAGV